MTLVCEQAVIEIPRGGLEGLDHANDSDREAGGRVRVIDYGDAREATVSWRRSSAGPPKWIGDASLARPEASKAAAVRKCRRYVTANRLVVAFTADYVDPPRYPKALSKDMRRFLSGVRRDARDGAPMPWLYVPEYGTQSERLHAHVLLPEVDHQVLFDNWSLGRGHVDNLPDVRDQRAFAEYLCKSFDTLPPRTRRYEVARGFVPESETYFVDSLADGYQLAMDLHQNELVVRHSRSPSTGAGSLMFAPSYAQGAIPGLSV